MRHFLTCLWILAGFSLARADERFDRANADFEAGRFKEAAVQYEGLLAEGPRVAVLQNLGSAYFRTGDQGRAILAFERALLLKPGDPDLRANLKLARDEAAVFPSEPSGGWQGLLLKPSRQWWSGWALVSAVLLPASAAGWILLRRRVRRAGLAALLTGSAALTLGGLSLHALDSRKDEDDRGIVIADPAKVRISPFGKADERASLAAGREVRVGRLENGYHWVSADSGGTEGWIAAGEVERIIPARSGGAGPRKP